MVWTPVLTLTYTVPISRPCPPRFIGDSLLTDGPTLDRGPFDPPTVEMDRRLPDEQRGRWTKTGADFFNENFVVQ